MKLGLVTYNLAKDWDLDTIIARCAQHRFAGVEVRTTHAHGVEVSLAHTLVHLTHPACVNLSVCHPTLRESDE